MNGGYGGYGGYGGGYGGGGYGGYNEYKNEVAKLQEVESEMQQDDDDSATSKKEILKLLEQLEAKVQQDGSDGDLNNKLAEAEFFKKIFRKVKKGLKKVGGGFLKGGLGLLGGGLGGFGGGGGCGGSYGGSYGGGYEKEAAKLQAIISKMQQDGDIDDVKAQLLSSLFTGLLGSGLGGLLGGRCETAKRQEHILETQQDDGDAELQTDSDALNELENIIAKQQNDKERDALTEVEEQDSQLNHLIATLKEEDNMAKSTQDGDEDDEC